MKPRGKQVAVSEEEAKGMKDLFLSGISTTEIVHKTGRARGTVYKIVYGRQYNNRDFFSLKGKTWLI